MITYVKGELTAIQEDAVVVDVHGIGYEVICPNPFVFQASLQTNIKIHTYHHVREDAQILYGFKTEDEKYLFKKLISVSGIGPKSALGILSKVHIPDFVAAIEREDDKFLTSFPGVGKKTARQIILDLKGKLDIQFSINEETTQQKQQATSTNTTALKEAIEALKALGYTDKEVKAITPKLQDSDDPTDDLIRKALGLLMKS